MPRSPKSCDKRRVMRASAPFFLRAATALSVMASLACGFAAAQRDDVTRDELTLLETERANALAQLNALEQAENNAVSDLGALERDLIAAAMQSRRHEEQATASERKLLTLRARLGAARREMLEGESALEQLMATLVVSGRHQPPALLVSPDDANGAIRSAIIMGDVAPRLKAMTQSLSEEIEELRRLERLETREQARLAAAEAELALKQEEILQMTAQKRAAFEDVAGDVNALRARVTLLGREADTIRSLLAALEANAPGAPGVKPALQYASLSPNVRAPVPTPPKPTVGALSAALPGGLDRPAAGRLVRAWGDKLPGGTTSEGLAIATRAQAQVAAPIDGRIEFAGPFRTYGQLLIISTSDGYHVLLSGMADAYVDVGQSVKRGEPVARMPNRVSPEPELYLEVRKDGKPMNPAKWMKSS